MEQSSLDKHKTPPGKSFVQWVATLGVGIQAGWTSPNVARFKSNESSIQIKVKEISWVVSLTGAGGLIGSILFSIFLEFIGGRRVILLTLVANSLSWICIIIARSVIWVYISRLLAGLFCVGAYSSFSIYLGEIAQPHFRGTMISIASSGNAAGVLFGITMETYISSTKVTSSIYIAFSVMAILLFLWLKDSPYYFAKRGDFEKAKESMAFYITGCDVEEQLLPVRTFVETSAKGSIKNKFKELNSPVTRKSIFIIFVIFGLPHLSGQVNVLSYMEIILKNAKSHLVNPQEFVIYANVISIIATILTVRLSDKFGRRVSLILSSIGTSIAMGCLALHFHLLNVNIDQQNLQWLPLFSIILYLVFYAVGYNPVPSTLLSELFPENVKSLAVCFATLGASTIAFIVMKAYQPIVDAFGEECIFFIHAMLSLLSIPCALFLLIETKGKTFQQIQDDLMK